MSDCTKSPGVRSVRIGEVLRQIIGRSIVKCVKRDLQLIGGNVQVCLGQNSGIKHAIHALRRRFLEDCTEGILLIDVRNAFNSLNRDLALQIYQNIKALSLNLYSNQKLPQTPSDIFIDKRVIKSQEGTTQDAPIAMTMHGVATFLSST